MNGEPSPQFVHILQATLAYWQRLTADLDDALIIQIDPDRRNLYQALDMGLSLPQTCTLAGEVAYQTFFLAERRGYWPEWITLFKRALAHCPDLVPVQRGHLLHRLGELYRHTYKLEEALIVHRQAEALAQELDDELALAEARYRLCWDFLYTRQYEEAERCCRFAIDTFTQRGVRADLLTNSYWALGSLARRRGELEMAQALLSQATDMARTTQQPTYQARMVEELGVTMSQNGAYAEALAYFDEATEILADTLSEREKLQVQLNRAVVFYQQRRWAEAEAIWQQVSNSVYLRQSGETDFQARLAHNLGNVLLKMGKLDEAEAQLNYALQLRLQLPDKVSQASTIGNLAQVQIKQGQAKKGILLFKEAHKILEDYPDDAHAQRVRQTIEAELRALENL